MKVHDSEMMDVDEDTYLVDIICSDGRNAKNLSSRISTGIEIITQITSMLEMVSLGHHFMEIALLFREALFLGCDYCAPSERCEIPVYSHRGGVNWLVFHTVY